MGLEVPKLRDLEVKEAKEAFVKNVVFWHRPSVVTRLDTVCRVSHVGRSEVLRLLVDAFLNNDEFQEKILRKILNNEEVVSILQKTIRGESNG